MQKVVEKEIKKIADELGIPYFVVEAVYTSQFKFLKEALSEHNNKEDKDSFVNVRFKYFGTLRFNDKKYNAWLKRQKNLTSGDSEEKESS